jgi:CheY-like chemotaxis protein
MLNPGTVLVVDDDENDLLFLQQAFEMASISNPTQILRNGFEAIYYLKGEGQYSDRKRYPLPCLMLLDLKMPGCDGFQVLAWRRSYRNISDFPVIVFSSSGLEKDIKRAMDLGATAYSVKPSSFDYLVTMAKELKARWLEPEKKRSAIREV